MELGWIFMVLKAEQQHVFLESVSDLASSPRYHIMIPALLCLFYFSHPTTIIQSGSESFDSRPRKKQMEIKNTVLVYLLWISPAIKVYRSTFCFKHDWTKRILLDIDPVQKHDKTSTGFAEPSICFMNKENRLLSSVSCFATVNTVFSNSRGN